MDREQEFQKAVYEFYEIYRELQMRMELRMASHISLYGDNYMEIWRYQGGARERLLLKAKTEKGEDDTDIECYRKAAGYLRDVLLEERERKGEAHGGVCADHTGPVAAMEGGHPQEAGGDGR